MYYVVFIHVCYEILPQTFNKGIHQKLLEFLFVISTGKSLNDKAINYWSFIIDLIELLIVQARFVFVSKKTILAIRGSFTSYV